MATADYAVHWSPLHAGVDLMQTAAVAARAHAGGRRWNVFERALARKTSELLVADGGPTTCLFPLKHE